MINSKRYISWSLVLLALVVLYTTVSLQRAIISGRQSASDAHGTLRVAQPIQNLGQIAERNPLQVTFLVQNVGDARLVLNEVDTECDCGDQITRTIIIQPGETEELSLLLDTRFSTGEIENRISFLTSDPSQPKVTLIAKANVTAPIPAQLADTNNDKHDSILVAE